MISRILALFAMAAVLPASARPQGIPEESAGGRGPGRGVWIGAGVRFLQSIRTSGTLSALARLPDCLSPSGGMRRRPRAIAGRTASDSGG